MYWKLLDIPDTDRLEAVRVSKGVVRDYVPNGDYALRGGHLGRDQEPMSNRGWLLAAVLLVLGGPLGGQEGKESPIAEENTAIRDKTKPVRANVPGAPLSLQAAPGHRQVRLRWTPAATRGAAIDSYQVRVDAGPWSTVPGLGAARDTTIAGLTNGTSYTFEVRAHNRVGAGAAASAEVAPAGGPGPATLAADPGDRQVERTCTEAAPNGAEVQVYRYRYRGASGWTGRDWHRVAGQGAARDTTLTGLSNGTLYTFEVRAITGKAPAGPTRRPPSR